MIATCDSEAGVSRRKKIAHPVRGGWRVLGAGVRRRRTAEWGVRWCGRAGIVLRGGVMFAAAFMSARLSPGRAGLGYLCQAFPPLTRWAIFGRPPEGGLRVRIAERHGWVRRRDADVLRAKG